MPQQVSKANCQTNRLLLSLVASHVGNLLDCELDYFDNIALIYSYLQAFLTGCSAGGLSTYIHCDDFRAVLPNTPTVKCLADGGFFLDVYDKYFFSVSAPCINSLALCHSEIHLFSGYFVEKQVELWYKLIANF